ILLQRQLHPAHSAGNTGSAITFQGSTFAFDEIPFLIEINVAMSRGGRHLSIIDRGAPAVLQTNHHETATPEIACGGMSDLECKSDRDRRVHCIATTLQDVHANLRR